MFMGRPISVAAAPLASNSVMSAARTSGGRQRRIMPIGRLMRPPGVPIVSGFVLFGLVPGGVGRTIRWVGRVDWPRPGRLGFRAAPPVRGMAIGCVMAVPAGMTAGDNKPVGWGGLTEGKEPVTGGFCIFGGFGCAFATGADTSGGFLSFFPNENNAICRGICV